RILNALLRGRAYRAEAARRRELWEGSIGNPDEPELRWIPAAQAGTQLVKQAIVVGKTEFVQLVRADRVRPVGKDANGPALSKIRAWARVTCAVIRER